MVENHYLCSPIMSKLINQARSAAKLLAEQCCGDGCVTNY